MCVRLFTIGLIFVSSEATKVRVGVKIGVFTCYLREKVFFLGGDHLVVVSVGLCIAPRH